MTSNAAECFVYITLPGQTVAITAGKYRFLTSATGETHGEFSYGHRYMERQDALELDPVDLVLGSDELFSTARHSGLFGAMRDACPDSWGRQVVEAQFGTPAVERPPMDYMLNSPDDRAGALGFGLSVQPPVPVRRVNRIDGLRRLMDNADCIVAAEENQFQAITAVDKDMQADIELAQQLVHAGTSLGGARPKVTVEDQDALWVAKFPQPKDKWNNPRVEYAMMQLARDCGITAAHTRIVTVGGRDVLLVKRFDRERLEGGYARTRMVSALTMLALDEDERDKWSYLSLAEELQRRAAANQTEQLHELFRRMTFNALISNTDDHPRNHACLAHGKSWDLSPAYDLTPTPVFSENRYLAMKCGFAGRAATRENLLSASAHFRLALGDAEQIVDGMTQTVHASWYTIVRAAGVTEADAEKVRRGFVCQGFGGRLLEP